VASAIARSHCFGLRYVCVSEDGGVAVLTWQHIAEGNGPHSVRRDKVKSYITVLKDYDVAHISNISVELARIEVLVASVSLMFSKT
jgi:hypothetical protein